MFNKLQIVWKQWVIILYIYILNIYIYIIILYIIIYTDSTVKFKSLYLFFSPIEHKNLVNCLEISLFYTNDWESYSKQSYVLNEIKLGQKKRRPIKGDLVSLGLW